MNIQYDNSDTIYITVQAINPSQTNSDTLICNITQQTNPIVQNLSDYDIYLQSLTCSSSELPYFNIYRQIAWDPANFSINITNMTISFISQTGTDRNFDLNGNTDPCLIGVGNNTGDTWQGCTCYLQYISENSPLLNTNTSDYPLTYFNVHSIQEFIDMINTAINKIAGVSGGLFAAGDYYFYYDPISQLYQFYAPVGFPASTLDMYTNNFLEYKLDNFRWQYLSNSTVVSPPQPPVNNVSPYNGLDNKFIKTNYPNNLANNIYTYYSEYSGLANLIDIHSLLVTATGGQLQTVRQQIIPSATFGQTSSSGSNALNLPTIACLKSLDIVLNGLDIASLNNSFIQFESPGLFYPINALVNQSLTQLNLTIKIQTIDNVVSSLMLPAGGGYANIRFVLKRKNLKK